ncbi:MAG: S1 RNA-binding domain-containing protein [Candidatus Izimaplasma sp.]|nr:S1 RNA-binding domain-containing protein [Candidatus Izimaplasma bacterium]
MQDNTPNYTSPTKPRPGSVVTGTVVRVTDEEVLVDIGYVTEGVIYKEHLALDSIESAKDTINEGDKLKVKVVKYIRNDEQTDWPLLSRKDILRKEQIDEFKDELEVNGNYEFKVKKAVKGGLLLDYKGIEVFLPDSLIFLREEDAKKEDLVNTKITAQLIEKKTEGRNTNLIANRKQVVYETNKAEREAELEQLKEGQVVTVTIEKIKDFGAFAKITEHIDGLIHISEISHYHVKDVTNYLEEGQSVEAKIIKIKGNRVSLSLKALEETPWEKFLKNYKVGDKVEGKIVRKMQFGMLIEVEKEVVGLLNRFDYSWNPNENLAGEVEVGDTIEVEITSINKKKKQFSVSKKHLEYNPWADLKLKKGELVSAEVVRIEDNGAVLKVDEVEGFLPIGEVSSEHITNLENELKPEDIITVEVKDFNPKKWHLVLSKKSVEEKKNRAVYEDELKENVSANQSLEDLFKKFKK